MAPCLHFFTQQVREPLAMGRRASFLAMPDFIELVQIPEIFIFLFFSKYFTIAAALLPPPEAIIANEINGL